MNKLFLSALVSCSGLCAASSLPSQGPSIYVAPSGGFETNITAAFEKKHVPAIVVTNAEQARYILQPSTVEIHKESAGSKFVRCAFAYCVGINDSGEVSVKLIDRETSQVVWAYEVSKQRANWNRQSMAEAIAKHLRKEFLRSDR